MIIPLPRYAELATTTNFSFLRGASHPEELVAKALELGHCGMGLADRNSVAGVVRAFGDTYFLGCAPVAGLAVKRCSPLLRGSGSRDRSAVPL